MSQNVLFHFLVGRVIFGLPRWQNATTYRRSHPNHPRPTSGAKQLPLHPTNAATVCIAHHRAPRPNDTECLGSHPRFSFGRQRDVLAKMNAKQRKGLPYQNSGDAGAAQQSNSRGRVGIPLGDGLFRRETIPFLSIHSLSVGASRADSFEGHYKLWCGMRLPRGYNFDAVPGMTPVRIYGYVSVNYGCLAWFQIQKTFRRRPTPRSQTLSKPNTKVCSSLGKYRDLVPRSRRFCCDHRPPMATNFLPRLLEKTAFRANFFLLFFALMLPSAMDGKMPTKRQSTLERPKGTAPDCRPVMPPGPAGRSLDSDGK